VWVPDESHEAMRDLPPARAAAVETSGYIISRSAASCSKAKGRIHATEGLDHAPPEMAAVAEVRPPSPPDRAPGDGRGRAVFEGARAASRGGDRGSCRIDIAPIVQALQGFQLASERKPLRSMPRGVDRLALAPVLPTSAAVLCGLATPIEVMILGCLEGARHFAGRRDVF
jgi:hypothetical protein